MAPKPQKTYRRLPGRAQKHFALLKNERCSLWLGHDHLLHIRRQYYRETAKRFYLKDLQAFNIGRTSWGRWLNIVLLGWIIGFTCTAVAAGIWMDWGVGLAVGIVPVFLLAGVLLNTAFGPTCACYLHTAVQTERLPSLGRLRTARRTVALLKPLIEAEQGRLTPEALEAHTGEHSDVQASVYALDRDGRWGRGAAPLRHETGAAHSILFPLFLPLAASNLVAVFHRNTGLLVFDVLCYLVIVGFLSAALIRQRNSDLPLNLRAMTWVALGALFADFLFGTLIRMGYEFIHAATDPGYVPSMYFDPNAVPLGWPPLDYYLFTVTLMHVTIAALGLLILRDFQRERRALEQLYAAASVPTAAQPPTPPATEQNSFPSPATPPDKNKEK